MDRLKLDMSKSDSDQGREGVFGMQPLLQGCQRVGDGVGWGWNEMSIAWAAPADPVLRPADLSRRFALATHSAHQDSMNIAE